MNKDNTKDEQKENSPNENINESENIKEKNETEQDAPETQGGNETQDQNGELEKKCAELETKLSDANDKYLRILAEFDNARKRSEKERLESFSNAQIKCISDFLPFVDAMDRAIAAECTDENYKSGIEKIYSQLTGILTKMGVTEIEALGQTFDPNLHNAIKQQETDEYDENTVCEVYQKGYKLGDKVIRYAMVVVAC